MTEPDRIERLEGQVRRLEAILAHLVRDQDSDGVLHALIYQITNDRADGLDEEFTSGEVWRMAVSEEAAAAAEGEPRPELITAMEKAGVFSSYGLGRWLAKQSRGFERLGKHRDGTLWRCIPIDQEPGGYAE